VGDVVKLHEKFSWFDTKNNETGTIFKELK